MKTYQGFDRNGRPVRMTVPEDSAPTAARAGASVAFSTRAFVSAHGKAPRGRGNWAFIDACHHDRDDYLNFVVWVYDATFADAKRAARSYFILRPEFSGVVVVCS